MAKIELKQHIAASPETVFRHATDLGGWPETISGITAVERLTDGPVGVGTRFKETRTMFGREATETMEFVAFDEPRGYTLGCENHGSRYRSDFSFESKAAGTDVTMTFEATPLTLMAKVMSVLMRPMMKSIAKHCLKDLEDLKASIEGSRPASS